METPTIQAGPPRLYIATCQVWVSATETMVVPIAGVFSSADAATGNAARVLTLVLAEQAPQHLDKPVSITPLALPDETVRDIVERLSRERPDLMPQKTKRGRARP